MRRLIVFAILATIVMAACASGPIASPASPRQGAGCGDGLCSGPENAQNCPGDCASPGASTQQGDAQQPLPAGDVPPLYFFYVIHTHVSADTLPYNQSLTQIDAQVAENMIAAIEGIQEILDRYGIPASWQVTYGVASGLCDYGGTDHVLHQLLDAGHEVALHAQGLVQYATPAQIAGLIEE